METVKSLGARRLPVNGALVFLDVTKNHDGYFAEMTGECDDWRDGPFATLEAAEGRIKEHALGLGLNPSPKHDVIRVVEAGHHKEGGEAVSFSRDQLAEIFKQTKAAAETMRHIEDGGTCNFDAPAFKIDGAPPKLIEGAAELAGVGVTDFEWHGDKRWYWLDVTEGQGLRRTLMAEAATKVLKEAGLDARTYYQMD